jgi:hypothetical protein
MGSSLVLGIKKPSPDTSRKVSNSRYTTCSGVLSDVLPQSFDGVKRGQIFMSKDFIHLIPLDKHFTGFVRTLKDFQAHISQFVIAGQNVGGGTLPIHIYVIPISG